jgi:hypothetical protein
LIHHTSSTPTTLKVIYKTRATAAGGRSGQSQFDDAEERIYQSANT